ncbi:MAG: DUF2314 domain-containing protein [Planctomycetes bacterium]|nr:DUF2314 domain-containing protein [Planctomycetota bacterium]
MAEEQSNHDSGGEWNLEPQESGFVAFWPHEDACTRAEFIAAVEAWVGDGIEHEAVESEENRGELWAVRLQVPGIESGMVVWCERASELSQRDQEQISEDGIQAPWVIRLQLILATEDAAEEYFMVMGLLGGSLPDIIAVLDVVTGEVNSREQLEHEFITEAATPTDRPLWKLARYGPLPGGNEACVVLGTQGLARCGLPELEMDEVPVDLADQASVVIFTLAGTLLGGDLPQPGGHVTIGDGLTISLQRVEDVVRFIEPNTAGSAAWRAQVRQQGYEEFGMERAVICGAEPAGQYTKAWSWPRDVVDRIASDRAVVYMSERWLQNAGRRAQATWPAFAMAFTNLIRSGKPQWAALARKSFVVQAPLDAGEGGRIEHSWMAVQAIDHDQVRLQVLEQPATRADLKPGDLLTVTRQSVADWRVQIFGFMFDPEASEQLLKAVDKIRDLQIGENDWPEGEGPEAADGPKDGTDHAG